MKLDKGSNASWRPVAKCMSISRMCVMVLQLTRVECGLVLARKSPHNPTMAKMPLHAISQKWLHAEMMHRMPAALKLKEKCVRTFSNFSMVRLSIPPHL